MPSGTRRSRKLLERRIGKTPEPRPRNEFLWFLRAFVGALVFVAAVAVYVLVLVSGR